MATQTTQALITDEQKTGASDEKPGLNDGINQNDDNDITPEEQELLDDAGTNASADHDSMLEDSDEDGDKLNEKDDLTGDDLDVPGSEQGDGDELPGNEDEENSSYSISDQDDDEDEPIL